MASTWKETVERIDTGIEELDLKREGGLKLSREIIRRSASLIMACHRGDPNEDLRSSFETIRTMLRKLHDDLADTPSLYHSGFVENAQTEAVEASMVVTLKFSEGNVMGKGGADEIAVTEAGTVFPDEKDLMVRGTAYLKGLGDTVGELRRSTLEMLKRGELELAAWYYGKMEEIYGLLTGLRYSHVSSDLRRKMDTARVLVERTLGELVNIQHMDSLKNGMTSAGKER